MNYLKRIGLIFLLVISILAVISLFLPSSFHIERSIVIDGDEEQIFKQINELKNWKNWSPWILKDETIFNSEEAYLTPSLGLGATFNWKSENDDIGKGSIEIVESTPNSYIKILRKSGFIESVCEWRVIAVETGYKVVRNMDVQFGFNPFSKYFGLFLEDKVALNYELSLKRLKVFVENLPKIHRVEVKNEFMDKDLWFLSIRDTVSQMEMSNLHGEIYAEINKYLEEQQLEINDSPLAIYHSFSESFIDIELGIPVGDSTIEGKGRIGLNRMKAGNYVTAIHYGSYDRLPETYFGINEWMRKNKVVVTGPPWESYITDPTLEPNPDKWQTGIYFPIE